MISRSALRNGVLCLAIVALPGLAYATPVTIDFESLADSEVVTNQFSDLTFSNATAVTAGTSLNEFDFPPYSGQTVVFDDGGPMSISFASPIDDFSGYFTYVAALSLTAYDASNNVIAVATSLFSNNTATGGDAGSSPNELLTVSSLLGISSIVIAGDSSGSSFTLDNLTYDTQGPQATVPEASTLELLLAGGLMLAGMRRRIRRQVEYR